MNCDEVRSNEIAEDYLHGRLDESVRLAYEAHYFECGECFEGLQSLRAAAGGLRTFTPPRARRLIWLGAIAAGVMVLGVGVWMRIPRPATAPVTTNTTAPVPMPQAAPEKSAFTQLARIDPPKGQARLRGTGDPSLSAAMKLYESGRYKEAAASFSTITKADPSAAVATFYLGICASLSGDADVAIEALEKTIRMGDTPYLEGSHFFLAKVLLSQNDPFGARRELERAIALHGDHEEEAKSILARLP